MKKFLIALSFLLCTVSVSAQINDTATLRGYINSTIVPNTSKSITAQMLSNILNGNLNVLPNLLGRYYDSIWISGGNLYMRKKGVTTNVAISAVESDPIWSAASVNYWLGSRTSDSLAIIRALANTRLTKSDADGYYPSITRTLDSLAALRSANAAKLNITDAASTYIAIARTLDSLAAVQARIQTKEPLLGFTPVPNTRTINGYPLTGNITLNKSDVGLGNVDNTSDANKPISTATQTALDGKVPTTRTVNGYALSSNITLNKSDVGLSNVPNTDATNASNISSGTLPDARLSSNVTVQGNSFNAANQLVKLDAGGKLPTSTIPSLALVETFVVNSQAAMLALSAQMGDVAVRTDNNRSYILQSEPASTLSNWVQLLTPDSETDPVYTASSWYSTTNNASNWNTAYSWGNHASAGYALTSGSYSNPSWITALSWSKITGAPSFLTSESDPVYVASSWYSTTNNASNWNTAYGWGNHATQGYITNSTSGLVNYYTATQIQNYFSGASAITGYNYSNWNTAYGWGNHAGLYPTYNGTGATGTWGINITGSATLWNNVALFPGSYTSGTIGTVLINNTTNSRVEFAAASAIQSFLGLGSNAYTSTSFLPLTAGSGNRLTGDLFLTNGYYLRGRNTANTADIAMIGIGSSGSDAPSKIIISPDNIDIYMGAKLGINIANPLKTLHTGGSGFYLSGYLPYTTYTPDGLFGSGATPNFLSSSGNGGAYGANGLHLGYWDNGSGLYSPAYGFTVKSTDGASIPNRVVPAMVMKDVDKNTTPWIVYNNGSMNMIGSLVAGSGNFSGELLVKSNMYISNTNENTINTGYSLAADASTNLGDFWVNYRGYNDGQAYFRDFKVGDGKGGTIAWFKGSDKSLTTYGVLRSTGDVIAYYTSDRRLKKNITPIANALHKISLLSGNEYDWDESLQSTYKGHDYGVIAQEVESVLPGATHKKADGFFGIKNQNQIIALLIQALKELKHEVELLKR